MPIVSLRQLLDDAAEHGYALPAFNVNNLEQIHAILQAARAVESPAILAVSAGGRAYAGEPFMRHLLLGAAEVYPEIPMAIHQDHGATLAFGTASNTGNIQMSFDKTPVSGPDIARGSDILTLNGIVQVGLGPPGDLRMLTDMYVLKLSYDLGSPALAYMIQNTGTGWINAVAMNSNQQGSVFNPSNDGITFVNDGGASAFNESYETYLFNNGGVPTLGDYGYFGGIAWAVLDHTQTGSGISEFAVTAVPVPEPGTYAMIFSGFGMLIGFRRLRRRSFAAKE